MEMIEFSCFARYNGWVTLRIYWGIPGEVHSAMESRHATFGNTNQPIRDYLYDLIEEHLEDEA